MGGFLACLTRDEYSGLSATRRQSQAAKGAAVCPLRTLRPLQNCGRWGCSAIGSLAGSPGKDAFVAALQRPTRADGVRPRARKVT
ncbi:MAG TPA: hypothetical protein QF564_32100 [Pirellulaceae bacterium]|nr:hypothetical protein [Pirellulaceae bacterium]